MEEGETRKGWAARAGLPALAALLGLWVIACAWFPLTDTDIWWHLASAKLMWASRAFLRADPFCVVSLGAPWTDLHWGFQLIAGALWKLGGAAALLAAKVLALLAAVALVLRPHWNRRTAYALAPLAAFGFYHIRFWLDMRPLAFTLLGLGCQYAVTMAYLQGRLRRPWLWLIPIQILLANLQGLYPLGAVLVSCFCLGRWMELRKAEGGVKTLAWTSAALWLAGWINPYGWEGFRLPLALLARISPMPGNVFSSQIAENQPFWDLARGHPGSALALAAFALAVLYSFRPARAHFSPGHALVLCAFGALGLMAQRNLPLFYLAALMAAGHNLQAAWAAGAGNPVPPGRGPAWRAAGLAALLAVMAGYGPRIRAAWDYELPGSLETPFRFPHRAADFLQAHPLPGNIFNELRYGGYLEWRLYPGKLSFVDGRMIVRGADFYRDFLDVVDHPDRFPPYQEKYGITHVLLPIAEDPRFIPLLGWLLRREWDLLHCDGASALLAQPGLAPGLALPLDSLGPGHPVRLELEGRFGANPRLRRLAEENLASLLAAAGKRAE